MYSEGPMIDVTTRFTSTRFTSRLLLLFSGVRFGLVNNCLKISLRFSLEKIGLLKMYSEGGMIDVTTGFT